MKGLNKQQLIQVMNDLDFAVVDIAIDVNGKELVGKQRDDGQIIYWPIEKEGGGFYRLFRGSIKKAVESRREL